MRVAGSLVVQAYMTPSACALQRFPTWMWRNKTVVAFLDWLHGRNTRLPQEEQRLLWSATPPLCPCPHCQDSSLPIH